MKKKSPNNEVAVTEEIRRMAEAAVQEKQDVAAWNAIALKRVTDHQEALKKRRELENAPVKPRTPPEPCKTCGVPKGSVVLTVEEFDKLSKYAYLGGMTPQNQILAQLPKTPQYIQIGANETPEQRLARSLQVAPLKKK
jgi:hypothetical protein